MTYELTIRCDSKEELIAFLQNQPKTLSGTDGQPQFQPSKRIDYDTIREAEEQAQKANKVEQQQQPVAPDPQPQQPAKQVKVDDIARACAPLMDKPEGVKMLQELLASYNASSLVDLPKEQLNDFAEKLKALGVEVNA